GKTFSTTNLFIGAGSTITVPDGCTITAANITCEGTGGLIKLEPGFKPLTISGKESAGTIKLVSDTPIEDDVQILNSANCPLGVFDVSGIKGESTDYCLTRTGSKVYCRKAAFLMNSVRYATFADMVSEIERVKDPTAVYDIKMQSDYDAAGALKFPKAGTCGEIKVIGSDYTITFTGNLSLTGNTSLNTVTLRSVNAAGVSAAYTMTVTNGDLSASGVNFGDITAITAANRKISLNVVTLGSKPVKIAAKEFSFMKVTGMVDSLTVDTIAATGSDDAQNTLKMLEKKQSRVNVGITDSSHKITFYYVKADGTDAPLVKGTVLFTVFKGNWDYTHNVWTDPFGASRDPKTFRVTASLH
ncbi:MAG: hypothetical protein IKO80_01340, partial [Lachnospiraceae bacterium]|nr:hypothetical protein [Lachnospiraceae bacterium]